MPGTDHPHVPMVLWRIGRGSHSGPGGPVVCGLLGLPDTNVSCQESGNAPSVEDSRQLFNGGTPMRLRYLPPQLLSSQPSHSPHPRPRARSPATAVTPRALPTPTPSAPSPAWRTATTTTTASPSCPTVPASRPRTGDTSRISRGAGPDHGPDQGVGFAARRLLQRPPWLPGGWRRGVADTASSQHRGEASPLRARCCSRRGSKPGHQGSRNAADGVRTAPSGRAA